MALRATKVDENALRAFSERRISGEEQANPPERLCACKTSSCRPVWPPHDSIPRAFAEGMSSSADFIDNI
jgi:hypothetical protein